MRRRRCPSSKPNAWIVVYDDLIPGFWAELYFELARLYSPAAGLHLIYPRAPRASATETETLIANMSM